MLIIFCIILSWLSKKRKSSGIPLTDPHATWLCQGFHRRTLSKQGRHTLNSQEVLPRERVDPICVWRRKSRTSPVFCWLSMARRTWSLKVERCWTHILHIHGIGNLSIHDLIKSLRIPHWLVEDTVVPWSHGQELYETCTRRKRLVFDSEELYWR